MTYRVSCQNCGKELSKKVHAAKGAKIVAVLDIGNRFN
jgi:hypothetical protein